MPRNEKTSAAVASKAGELLRQHGDLLQLADELVATVTAFRHVVRAQTKIVKSVAASALTQVKDRS